MENLLMNVKIEALVPNEQNEVLSLESLDVLEDSIKEFGIISPITVCYKKGVNNKFTVLSGHKRLAAAKNIGLTEVPIQVIDAPKNDDEEFNALLQSNICRNSEEEVNRLIMVASEHWDNKLDRATKEKRTIVLKENYLKRMKTDSENAGISDEELLQGFRAKDEYIRSTTGINLSYRSIRRKIQEEEHKDEPKVAKEVKPKRKTRSFSDFCKASVYELRYLTSENAEEELPIDVQQKIDELIDIMLPYIKKD